MKDGERDLSQMDVRRRKTLFKSFSVGAHQGVGHAVKPLSAC